jgi:TfoX/Sxy family transcriptional regulator of competence genes
MAFDPGTAERIRSLLTGQRGVVEKRMFGGIAFMVHDHMCVGISGGDLMVRVGATGHAEALAQPHARPMDFTGRPMKGFVFVSPAGYESDAALQSWLDRGLRHARSLPPK